MFRLSGSVGGVAKRIEKTVLLNQRRARERHAKRSEEEKAVLLNHPGVEGAGADAGIGGPRPPRGRGGGRPNSRSEPRCAAR